MKKQISALEKPNTSSRILDRIEEAMTETKDLLHSSLLYLYGYDQNNIPCGLMIRESRGKDFSLAEIICTNAPTESGVRAP